LARLSRANRATGSWQADVTQVNKKQGVLVALALFPS
jgi:hypothetical protein